MSGGYFDYLQYRIESCAEDVESLVHTGEALPYTGETVERLILTSQALEKVAKMLQRVDWLISGDDDEESFNRRWIEEGLFCKESL